VEAERLGERPHQLAQRPLELRAGARGRAGGQEQGPCLGGAEPAQVGPAATGEAPAPAAALLGVDGEAGHAERIEVSPGGALGHLELGRHLGGGHQPPPLEEQEDGDEAVGTHDDIFLAKPVRRWPVHSCTMAA
jgi:hypothetical protein